MYVPCHFSCLDLSMHAPTGHDFLHRIFPQCVFIYNCTSDRLVTLAQPRGTNFRARTVVTWSKSAYLQSDHPQKRFSPPFRPPFPHRIYERSIRIQPIRYCQSVHIAKISTEYKINCLKAIVNSLPTFDCNQAFISK